MNKTDNNPIPFSDIVDMALTNLVEEDMTYKDQVDNMLLASSVSKDPVNEAGEHEVIVSTYGRSIHAFVHNDLIVRTDDGILVPEDSIMSQFK